jgi:2-polyprenyl-3-methyl-5-hydroxy-6-metoxy-1,4-benzoquinol methylase
MSRWSEFLGAFTLVDTARARGRLIDSILSRSPRNGKLLEIGFGSGKMAILLADMGYRITAIDLDDAVIQSP